MRVCADSVLCLVVPLGAQCCAAWCCHGACRGGATAMGLHGSAIGGNFMAVRVVAMPRIFPVKCIVVVSNDLQRHIVGSSVHAQSSVAKRGLVVTSV